MENNVDGIINLPKKDFVKIMIETKPNQGITVQWISRQLRELILIGSVRNLRQISPNQVEMEVKSIIKDIVKTAVDRNSETMKFEEVD